MPETVRESVGSPGTGINRKLRTTMWVLGTEPGSSEEQPIFLTAKSSLQYYFLFIYYYLFSIFVFDSSYLNMVEVLYCGFDLQNP